MNLDSDFQILFTQNRFSEIIEKSNVHGITPGTQPNLSRYVAAAYFSLGDYTASDQILVQLESSFSDDPSFLSLYAATCRRLSRFQKAEILFQKALSLNPESLQIQNNYANLLIDLSKYDQAYDLLQSIVSVEPSYSDALNNLNRLSALREPQSSTAVVADFNFQDPLLFAFEKSEVDHSLKRYKMSKESLSEAQLKLSKLSNPKDHSVALEQLAASRRALEEKQIDLSLSCCSQAYRILGPNPDIYDLASDIYLNLNKFQDAELYLLQAVAIDGLSLKRCFNLVSFAIMRRDIESAKYYFDKATGIDPSAPDLVRL